MKFIKKAALVLLGLMMLFGVIGLFLPSSQHVERQVTIDAPASQVFPYLNDFRKFNEWNPWAKLDPNTQYTFSGTDSGTGAIMQWSSEHEHVGKGSQQIVDSRLNEFVETELDFGFGAPAKAAFTLSEVAGQTTVVWAFDAYLGNTISRYFGLMMDSWVGASYEQGLADLKALVESS